MITALRIDTKYFVTFSLSNCFQFFTCGFQACNNIVCRTYGKRDQECRQHTDDRDNVLNGNRRANHTRLVCGHTDSEGRK